MRNKNKVRVTSISRYLINLFFIIINIVITDNRMVITSYNIYYMSMNNIDHYKSNIHLLTPPILVFFISMVISNN